MARLLVVEDDERIGSLVSAQLRALGDDVVWARTLAAGWDAATEAPDLVLLDLGLPDGDGVDLVRGLRRLHPETVVTEFRLSVNVVVEPTWVRKQPSGTETVNGWPSGVNGAAGARAMAADVQVAAATILRFGASGPAAARVRRSSGPAAGGSGSRTGRRPRGAPYRVDPT